VGPAVPGVAGNVYYFNSSSTWTPTDADASNTSKGLLAIMTNSTGFNLGMMVRGYFRNSAWSFTPGDILYLSTTAGSITNVQPSGSGDIVRVVGFAIAADTIYFNPSNEWIELV
jgi:hypothetical protein